MGGKNHNLFEILIPQLAVLLGLPWILSLLQGIFNNHYLLWVSIVVNSLQGVMMLVTFMLTPSVKKLVRLPHCAGQKPSDSTEEEPDA